MLPFSFEGATNSKIPPPNRVQFNLILTEEWDSLVE